MGVGESNRVRPMRRIVALGIDLSIIAVWAAVAGLVALVLGWIGLRFETAAGRDALAFVTLVLPVALTFAYQEAGPRQATLGKRRMGLVAVDGNGSRLAPGRSLARSALKLLPWQLGHSAVFRLVADADSVAWLIVSLVAQAIVLVSLSMVVLGAQGRALHDVVAGTRVAVRKS